MRSARPDERDRVVSPIVLVAELVMPVGIRIAESSTLLTMLPTVVVRVGRVRGQQTQAHRCQRSKSLPSLHALRLSPLGKASALDRECAS